jgi:hypothetical protein
MNSVSVSGKVESRPKVRGIPGRDECRFWFCDESAPGDFALHIEVLAERRLAVEAGERLSEGDWVAIGGYLRSIELRARGGVLYEHVLVARHIDFGVGGERGAVG